MAVLSGFDVIVIGFIDLCLMLVQDRDGLSRLIIPNFGPPKVESDDLDASQSVNKDKLVGHQNRLDKRLPASLVSRRFSKESANRRELFLVHRPPIDQPEQPADFAPGDRSCRQYQRRASIERATSIMNGWFIRKSA